MTTGSSGGARASGAPPARDPARGSSALVEGPAPSIHVRVIDSDAELAALGPTWERLQAGAAVASVFGSFDWQHAWWKAYGRGAALRLLVAADGAEVVGLLALYVSTERAMGCPVRLLRFVGTGGDTSPDDLGPVLARGREEEVARALADAVLRVPGWDVLRLHDMEPPVAVRGRAGGRGAPRLGDLRHRPLGAHLLRRAAGELGRVARVAAPRPPLPHQERAQEPHRRAPGSPLLRVDGRGDARRRRGSPDPAAPRALAGHGTAARVLVARVRRLPPRGDARLLRARPAPAVRARARRRRSRRCTTSTGSGGPST